MRGNYRTLGGVHLRGSWLKKCKPEKSRMESGARKMAQNISPQGGQDSEDSAELNVFDVSDDDGGSEAGNTIRDGRKRAARTKADGEDGT